MMEIPFSYINWCTGCKCVVAECTKENQHWLGHWKRYVLLEEVAEHLRGLSKDIEREGG